MAEGFVKRFKHDYVYVNELRNAGVVLRSIPAWIEDYNNNAPHSALRMRSPREFRQSRIH
jgi:transposase InsO family protein